MTRDELSTQAAKLFPIAVENALERPKEANAELLFLKQLCWENFKSMGFDCMASCFEAIIPKTEGKLDITSWSSAEMTVLPWTFRVSCRPFFLSSTSAHLEIRHNGRLPSVTESGYLSIFTPMDSFANRSPEDFIRMNVCKHLPKSTQMTLF